MHPKKSSGFTLIEVLIAVVLFGLIITGVLGFYIQSLTTAFTIDQKLKLATEMRVFTDELVFNGSRSHELILYKSSAAADRGWVDANADGVCDSRLVVTNEGTETTTDDICPTGNFAVFVTYEVPKPADQAKYRIRQIVGYYLDQQGAGAPALMRITINKTTPSTDRVETLLADNWASAPRKRIAPRITALAFSENYTGSTVPQLFYRRASQNIAVCGQFLESAKRTDTRNLRTYTRTFYFNVTVRS